MAKQLRIYECVAHGFYDGQPWKKVMVLKAFSPAQAGWKAKYLALIDRGHSKDKAKYLVSQCSAVVVELLPRRRREESKLQMQLNFNEEVR